MAKTLGFVGIESYDVMLTLTALLKELGLSVALQDLSYDKSLVYSIPGLNDCDGSKVCEWHDCLVADGEYDFPETDYLLIYFGRNLNNTDQCDEIYAVTDQQNHNIEFLKQLELNGDQYPVVIYRHFQTKIKKSYVAYELQFLELEENALLEMLDTEQTIEMKVAMQYNVDKCIRKVSQDTLNVCKFIVATDFSEKQVESAVRVVKKLGMR